MGHAVRRALDNSHVAAVAIAILLLSMVGSILQALRAPFWHLLYFIINALAILEIPHLSRTLTTSDWMELIPTLANLFYGLVSLAAAWALSKWVYGSGPLCSLRRVGSQLTRRNHA